ATACCQFATETNPIASRGLQKLAAIGFAPGSGSDSELPGEPAAEASGGGVAGQLGDDGDRLGIVAEVALRQLAPGVVEQLAEAVALALELALEVARTVVERAGDLLEARPAGRQQKRDRA